MTSQITWLFLLIVVLDGCVLPIGSMDFRFALLTSASSAADQDGGRRGDDRATAANAEILPPGDPKELRSTTNGSKSNGRSRTATSSDDSTPPGGNQTGTAPAGAGDPPAAPLCSPCVVWEPKLDNGEGEKAASDIGAHPNLTIIPLASVFVFLVCVVMKCIHWCNEDVRLADERYLKISVPLYPSPPDSPLSSPTSRPPGGSSSGSTRRTAHSSLSSAPASLTAAPAHARHPLKARQRSNADDDETALVAETSSEEATLLFDQKYRPALPAVGASAGAAVRGADAAVARDGKDIAHVHGRTRAPSGRLGQARPQMERYFRSQSLQSSSMTTISSGVSTRSPPTRGRTISFEDSGGSGVVNPGCSSPSSSTGTAPDSYLDGSTAPLIRHSASSGETPFTHRKFSFRTHLLTPPLLHFRMSSVDTSTTSLGESLPSAASRPSMCESALTEQLTLSEMAFSEDSADSFAGSGNDVFVSGENVRTYHQGGMMLLTGSYYEDPLVVECQYLHVDAAPSRSVGGKSVAEDEPAPPKATFSLSSNTSSSNSSTSSDINDVDEPTVVVCSGGRDDCQSSSTGNRNSDAISEEADDHCCYFHDGGEKGEGDLEEEDADTDAGPLTEATDSSGEECNSETELTVHAELHPRPPSPDRPSKDNHSPPRSPRGVGPRRPRRALDPSIFYQLSVESNASTGSLQSPESLLSDSTSGSSDMGVPLRRFGAAVAFRAINPPQLPASGSTLKADARERRRERISLNGLSYTAGGQGGRRIQNGKVMRMCRSWCVGDKASAIYDQLRRGLLEKECYM